MTSEFKSLLYKTLTQNKHLGSVDSTVADRDLLIDVSATVFSCLADDSIRDTPAIEEYHMYDDNQAEYFLDNGESIMITVHGGWSCVDVIQEGRDCA